MLSYVYNENLETDVSFKAVTVIVPGSSNRHDCYANFSFIGYHNNYNNINDKPISSKLFGEEGWDSADFLFVPTFTKTFCFRCYRTLEDNVA